MTREQLAHYAARWPGITLDELNERMAVASLSEEEPGPGTWLLSEAVEVPGRDAAGRFAAAQAQADALQDRLDRDYAGPEVERLAQVAANLRSGKSVTVEVPNRTDDDDAEVKRLATLAAQLVEEEPAASKPRRTTSDDAEVARLAELAGGLR